MSFEIEDLFFKTHIGKLCVIFTSVERATSFCSGPHAGYVYAL